MSDLTLLPDGWMDRDEVMKELQKSQSTIERLVVSGDIKTKLKPVPHRKPIRLYWSQDIEKLAQEAQRRDHRAVVRKERSQALPAALPPPATALLPPAPELPWISLEEAAALSGLAESYILGRIDVGRIVAVKGGAHGAWRVHRKSLLEEFRG